MLSEQRELLDENLRKIRAGRMTRRSFLECALFVGLSSSAAVSLLEACAGSSNSTRGNGAATNILWTGDSRVSFLYQKLVDTFNKTNRDGIHVTYIEGRVNLGFIYRLMFHARANTTDILSLDVIWPIEFGAANWLVPLEQKWSSSERVQYFPGPLQTCSYEGKLWAVPFATDAGLLYSRSHLISTTPATWDQMASLAQSALSQVPYGYIWQGQQYESLVCNFVEVLYGYGGAVLDKTNLKRVIVNSPEAMQALVEMISWVGTISPLSITTPTGDPEYIVYSEWEAGQAAFMRNWGADAVGLDTKTAKVVGKFDVHSTLAGEENTKGRSCVGGWDLGINAFSKNVDASWTFIHYLLGADVQKALTLSKSRFATLQSVYEDAEVLAEVPMVRHLKPIFLDALPRPLSPVYSDMSEAIQLHIHQALTRQTSPADALSALQSDLQTIIVRT
jgi:ABC-type glycerol-3-phosphate transport system substrate-binding protein